MKKLIAVLSILAVTVSANADLLAGWDVTGVNAAATPVFTCTTVGANVTLSSTVLSLGLGITPSGAANTFVGSTWTAANYADAVTSNDYVSWFIQADPGFSLTVTNIFFNFARTATGGSNIVVQSSFDGFSANLFASNNVGLTFVPTFGVSLSGSNSVEFRLYGWAASGSTGTLGIRNLAAEDLVVEGTVIPEAGTMAMMSIGLLGLAILRRRMG